MSTKFYANTALFVVGLTSACYSQQPAVRSLSNLTTTSINMDLLPQKTSQSNLGSSALKWKQLYLNNIVFADGNVQNTAFVPYTSGYGISIIGTTISNIAPDKVVTLRAGEGINVSGRYPNFIISGTGGSTPWSSNGNAIFCTTQNVGIGTNNPAAKLHVYGADAIINGLTIGSGGGNQEGNTAAGFEVLRNNTTGFINTGFGSHALSNNKTGYDNAAIGNHALFSNLDGIQNAALGNGALYYNISGVGNTATGNAALLNNGNVSNLYIQEASYNVANGFSAMTNNTSGSLNTGIGVAALATNNTGNYNTAVGAFSDVAAENLENAGAFGGNALVNASNKIRLGDVNVSIVESSSGSWTTSDGRFKTNVREAVSGLPFINRLRPVVYQFEAEKFDDFLSQRMPDSTRLKRKEANRKNIHTRSADAIQTGFIAQEVQEAAKLSGFTFNGVHVPETAYDNYSISYEKMVVPLVKAVQELSKQNDDMKKELAELKTILFQLQAYKQVTFEVSPASLAQNIPNPVRNVTTVAYTLPANSKMAELRIIDQQGRIVQKYSLKGTGRATVSIDASGLLPGTYQYQLWLNGNAAATKQMLVIK